MDKERKGKCIGSVIVLLLSAVLFIAMTMPFRLRLSMADITDMRPTSALTPVLGMIFGWPAAIGCAVGGLISDLASRYELSYAIAGIPQQLIYGMVPYYLWKKINREHDGNEFRLDSIARVLKFCLVLLLDAGLVVLCTGMLNHAYEVSDFLSINNFYLFLNTFDSGLLFGCPILIAGHFLDRYLHNLRNENKEKVFTFSLNERMILNTIITGLCICFFVGVAVYFTDKMSEQGSSVSIWGRIYIFQMTTLNLYFLLSMGFMWFTEQRVARPIEDLAHIAENYYVAHATDEQRGNMLSACEKYATDSTEVGNLARSYITMVEDLKQYVTNLQNVTAEKERINAELTLASDIQAHMLPCIFPAFPGYDEFEVYASMTPAKEVGGDFYDYFMIDKTHLAVVMADVSGKGVPAALFMVIAKTLIKNYAQMGLEVDEVFTTVNQLLCEGNDAGLFVTTWLGILELTTGKLSYANAGHNFPLIKLGEEDFSYLKVRTGFILAGMEDSKYKKKELYMKPGDRLFLYTDGNTEAENIEKELYGEERLQQFLNQHKEVAAEELLHMLKADIDQFVGEAEQFDDITMLMLDLKKLAEDAR